MKVGDEVVKVGYEFPSGVPEGTLGVVAEAFGEHLREDPLEYRKQVCVSWGNGIGEWTHIGYVELVESEE
tara:strand:+ start:1521 stop:1730 length:210 start_codon:yes stop_codon:yes gene_type:complete